MYLIAKILETDINTVLKMDIPFLTASVNAVRLNTTKSEQRAQENVMDDYNKDQFAGIRAMQIMVESMFGGESKNSKGENRVRNVSERS